MADRENSPGPADADDGQGRGAGLRFQRARFLQLLMQDVSVRSRSVRRLERNDHHQCDQSAHQQVDQRPAHPRGEHKRERSADDGCDAVAELVDGREKFDRCLLIRDIDPPSVDGNILRRRRKRSDHSKDRESADIRRRVGRGETGEGSDHHRLAKHDPALPPPDALKDRQWQPVNNRRPQELEAIGKPDPRQHADGREIDLRFAEPGIQRADQQRVRQTRRESEGQHGRRFARRQRRPEQFPSLWTLSCHRSPPRLLDRALAWFHDLPSPAMNGRSVSPPRRRLCRARRPSEL